MNLDYNDPKYAEAAGRILQRHARYEAEANITSAIRDFLILTDLANADEIVEENPPDGEGRRAVDLTALDTFIEMKRRVGSGQGFSPDAKNVKQLDDYLDASQLEGKGRLRTGILTDGKYWLSALAGGRGSKDPAAVRFRPGKRRKLGASLRVAEGRGPGLP